MSPLTEILKKNASKKIAHRYHRVQNTRIMKVGYKLHIFYSPLPRSSFWLDARRYVVSERRPAALPPLGGARLRRWASLNSGVSS